MKGRVAYSGKHGKHKKVDRLTKAERRARLVRRREQWLERWVALAEAFVEMVLDAEVQELLGREPYQWGDRTASVEVNPSLRRTAMIAGAISRAGFVATGLTRAAYRRRTSSSTSACRAYVVLVVGRWT